MARRFLPPIAVRVSRRRGRRSRFGGGIDPPLGDVVPRVRDDVAGWIDRRRRGRRRRRPAFVVGVGGGGGGGPFRTVVVIRRGGWSEQRVRRIVAGDRIAPPSRG